jgi:hypothetical protein
VSGIYGINENALRQRSNGTWINRVDSVVASEVAWVERENLSDSMRLHRRRKPGIVDFDAEDTVGDNQLPPCAVRGLGVRQDAEIFFEKPRMTVRTRGAHSEAVLIGWAGANVPEFPDVLWRKAETTATPMQTLQRLPRDRAERAVMLNGAKQNVGINEYGNKRRCYHRSGYQFSRFSASSLRTGCWGKLSSHSSNSFSH